MFTNADRIGWWLFDILTVNGNVAGNIIDSSENTNDGYDWWMLNMLTINGSLVGDYGFYLDASGGGTVDFDGNSAESELISSNNGTGLFSGSGDINYNG